MASRAEDIAPPDGPDEEVELSQLKPEVNVPETDQRTHVVLTDERFIEYMARVPRGVQKDVSAVMLSIKGWQDEIIRLRRLEKTIPDARGNVRVLKDRTQYMVRHLKPCTKCAAWRPDEERFTLAEGCEHTPAQHPTLTRRSFWQWFWGKPKPARNLTEDDYIVEVRSAGIYTVLPQVQLQLYRRKFERQTAQALDWVWRIMRLWIGEDGKGRTEMIDALQASNGKLMPPGGAGVPMVFMNGASDGPRPGGWPKNR